jgi:hypothetical protein
VELCNRLRNFIDYSNFRALGKDEKSDRTVLSSYKLSSKEQKSTTLVSFGRP